MSENQPTPPSAATGEVCISCQRLRRRRTIAEHRSCPYCFGDPVEIARGDYERFCDYWRAFDPVSFGFPETYGRYAWRDAPRSSGA
ncbi:MAG: hypothetical protein U1E76_24105 [Planctomycetota bacterium]